MRSLEDFFPTYLALLEAGDADGLGLLYAEQAVLTSFGGPQGTTWSVGRERIVAGLAAALKDFRIVTEVQSTTPYGAGVRGAGPQPDGGLAVPE